MAEELSMIELGRCACYKESFGFQIAFRVKQTCGFVAGKKFDCIVKILSVGCISYFADLVQ